MDLRAALAMVFGVLALLAALAWLSKYPDYEACLQNPNISTNDCFIGYLMLSPPIQEAQDIADACNRSDSECLQKVGTKALEEHVTSDP